jgi:hypothetical protein
LQHPRIAAGSAACRAVAISEGGSVSLAVSRVSRETPAPPSCSTPCRRRGAPKPGEGGSTFLSSFVVKGSPLSHICIILSHSGAGSPRNPLSPSLTVRQSNSRVYKFPGAISFPKPGCRWEFPAPCQALPAGCQDFTLVHLLGYTKGSRGFTQFHLLGWSSRLATGVGSPWSRRRALDVWIFAMICYRVASAAAPPQRSPCRIRMSISRISRSRSIAAVRDQNIRPHSPFGFRISFGFRDSDFGFRGRSRALCQNDPQLKPSIFPPQVCQNGTKPPSDPKYLRSAKGPPSLCQGLDAHGTPVFIGLPRVPRVPRVLAGGWGAQSPTRCSAFDVRLFGVRCFSGFNPCPSVVNHPILSEVCPGLSEICQRSAP